MAQVRYGGARGDHSQLIVVVNQGQALAAAAKADMALLLAKLDLDAGVTDTDYASSITGLSSASDQDTLASV